MRRIWPGGDDLEELPRAVGVRVIVLGGSQRALGDSARGAEIIWLEEAEALPKTVGEVPADVFVWAAGEADVMRGLRGYLRDDQRADPARVSIHGYWRTGHAGSLPREEEG